VFLVVVEMVEEKKNVVKNKQSMFDLSRELNELSKNAGSVSFSVGYTATEGNISIHEAFQRFAFESANNEYLMAIGKLLEYKDIFEYLLDLNQRVSVVESEVKVLGVKEESVVVPEVKEKENKTF
jgi:hypothetical protein